MYMKYRTETGNAGLMRCLLLTAAGVIMGSVLYAAYPAASLWQNPLFRQGMGTDPAAHTLLRMLAELCAVPLFWLFCTAVCGVSLAGKPLAYGLLLLRGTALGALLCGVYSQQGAAGFLTAVLFIMPFALCSLLLFVVGIKEALRLSASLLRMLAGNREETLSVRSYVVRFLVLAGVTVIAGLLQGIWLRQVYPMFLDFMAGR